MAWGSGGIGFGGGLARGLARGLLRHSQQQREDALRAEEKARQNDMMFLPMALEQMQKTGDASAVQQLVTRIAPDLEKLFKKSGSPFEMLAPILTSKPPTEAETTLGPGNEAIGQVLGQEQAPIPSTQRAGASSTTPRWLFGDSLIENASERQARDLSGKVAETTAVEGAKLDAQGDAKLRLARRLIELGTEPEQALFAVGLKVPEDQYGVIPAGGGVLNKKTGDIKEPPSARATNLPAPLREHVERLRSMHPDWDEAMLRQEATKRLDQIDADEKKAKETAAQSIQASRSEANATRDLQQAILRLQVQAGGLTPSQVMNETSQLRDSWQKLITPVIERQEAVSRVDSAIAALDRGDRQAAVDAILVAFGKLEDERTGVREGEVRRLIDGLGLPSRISGAITKLKQDGIAMPDANVRQLARLAKETARDMDRIRGAELKNYRSAVEESIKPHGIPSSRIFGDSPLGKSGAAAANPGGMVTVTLNGKPFTGTQAQVDAFKRQFPDAK